MGHFEKTIDDPCFLVCCSIVNGPPDLRGAPGKQCAMSRPMHRSKQSALFDHLIGA
jgi:hypothetical protein